MTNSIQLTKISAGIPRRDKYQDLIEEMFFMAGIKINGSRPFDIQVNHPSFYKRIMADGTLGLGEAYMDGWWECEKIDEMFERLLRANLQKRLNKNLKFIFYALKAKLSQGGKKSKAFEIGEKHYNFGNDLFQAMLDKGMNYSCAYWNGAENLDKAQENKLDLICKKIRIKPGMRVLDIGCGWGDFARFAAQNYGVHVVGITVSKEQLKLGKELCGNFPIELRYQDYRDLNEKFDAIVSIGMFEHVCHPKYRIFMRIVKQCLEEHGLFLLHTIGSNVRLYPRDAPWISKYIFPNSELPTIQQIGKACEGIFVMEDWHNFGADYDKTLMAWFQNFLFGWDKLKAKYDERFFRMWKFYLLLSAGLFRTRFTQLWQIVFSKKGIPGGYQKYIDYNFKNLI